MPPNWNRTPCKRSATTMAGTAPHPSKSPTRPFKIRCTLDGPRGHVNQRGHEKRCGKYPRPRDSVVIQLLQSNCGPGRSQRGAGRQHGPRQYPFRNMHVDFPLLLRFQILMRPQHKQIRCDQCRFDHCSFNATIVNAIAILRTSPREPRPVPRPSFHPRGPSDSRPY